MSVCIACDIDTDVWEQMPLPSSICLWLMSLELVGDRMASGYKNSVPYGLYFPYTPLPSLPLLPYLRTWLLLLMAYSSWVLLCPPLIARSPEWLPSSMQMRGRYSVASYPPQLLYGWVFLSVASSPREAFGLLMQLNGDALCLVNCRWCGQRGAIFCWLWCEREADNLEMCRTSILVILRV